MFKIYDLNMNEIPFPDGVMPLEIFVGSIGKDRVTKAVDGRPGVVDYGFNYTDRPVSLFLRIKAADKVDFRLLRNEVFATFDVGSAFYIAESDVPSRVLKVVVDESYIPDRLTEEYADFDINCRTLDSVFWESKYTTLELHDSGYSATVEKYGLVDNIDDEKDKYRFSVEGERDVVWELHSYDFENGAIYSGNGEENNDDINSIRTSDYISIKPGVEYNFIDDGGHENINYYWIFEYDVNGIFIRSTNTSVGGSPHQRTFVSVGSQMRIMASAKTGNNVPLEHVGTNITPRMAYVEFSTTFNVYNAGNVTIAPESMRLNIYVSALETSGGFTIRNNTTGEELILNRASDGFGFRVQGMVISLGAITNVFRDTNRRFISLAPGDNEFEVFGGNFNEISFDFKYLYK